MSKVFIAGSFSCLDRALEAKSMLVDAGHEITSTWHDSERKTMFTMSPEEQARVADRVIDEIIASDAVLVSAYCPNSFMECGIAVGLGLPVVTMLGAPEVMLSTNLVHQYDSLHAMIERIDDLVGMYDDLKYDDAGIDLEMDDDLDDDGLDDLDDEEEDD